MASKWHNKLIEQRTTRFQKLLNSALPRAITQIVTLGFASSDYFSYLHWATLRAITFRIAFYAVKLAYKIKKQTYIKECYLHGKKAAHPEYSNRTLLSVYRRSQLHLTCFCNNWHVIDTLRGRKFHDNYLMNAIENIAD